LDTGLNIHVLVVDDNNINRLLINRVLTKWEATAEFAENGIQAVDKIKTKNFDVVLMDIYMPEMGGIEATQIIRSMPDTYFHEVPIIALTASLLSSEKAQMAEAGMNDFILKPFEPKDLYNKLSAYQRV
jgi:CheY-like chemotaxis protein